MRGTRSGMVYGSLDGGLIPTYAGNTTQHKIGKAVQWAHPHVCGEHMQQVTYALKPVGSSPRMRGTLGISDIVMGCPGLIPTYAGNTLRPRAVFRFFRAHPHVCGEHPVYPASIMPGAGSSPRMRGTLVAF